MKYTYTETTLDTLVQADHIFEWPIHHDGNSYLFLTGTTNHAVHRTITNEKAGRAALLGKPTSQGIIEVCKNSERYMRWCPETYEGPHNSTRERQVQQAFTDWLAHIPQGARFTFLSNEAVDAHGQRFPKMLGYGMKEVVIDAIYGNSHYVAILDGRHERTLAKLRERLPGEYEDVWDTLQYMVSSGMVSPNTTKKPKVGLEKIPAKIAEKRHLRDWYLMIYHHPGSVDRLPKSL
jgi:hypothetical protein